ncbi:hypothetical protein BOTU111921_13155 [Bordetella tumbae]|uniref:S8 family peptidase n=1 Tax=Bordetella tumbae TaxID=1649139 RepID=UPI0039EE1661
MVFSSRSTALVLLSSFITLIDLQVSPVHAHAAGNPSDPETWRTQEYRAQWGLDFINAANAYALGLDGRGVKIGVVDSGIDSHHPEFLHRTGGGYGSVTNIAMLTDSDGHGTMVSSVISANRNGIGMHGVAPGATIFVPNLIAGGDDEEDRLFAEAWDEMLDQGVRIVNNSWAWPDIPITDEPADYWRASQPNLIAAARRAVSAGALMIFAAGNESGSSPESPAGLPYYFRDLESGWLAVAALSPDGMPSWSNRCGVAMDWCLSAPGGGEGWVWDASVEDLTYVGESDDIFMARAGGGYTTAAGTSFAAPHVTGAAALVAQRFPYLTMAQVRQVLLGTAADVGDPGVDEVYGYGVLDVGKAVLGPGKFDWGDFHVSFDQGYSTWGNDITGAGGLIKSGTGSLELTGDSTYAGETHVNGGELAIAGSIASQTVVGRAGMLSGGGAIIGDVDNQGIVAPGLYRSGGTLLVDGDYVQRRGAALLVDVNASQGTGLLDVTGEAQIDGGKVAVALAPGAYRGDERHTILSADDAVSGRYDELCKCFAFLDVSLAYDPQNVYLDIERNGVAFTEVAASHNQRAVGAAIELMDGDAADTPESGHGADAITSRSIATSVMAGSTVAATLFDHIVVMGAPAARAAFDSLSGELHPSVASALIDDSRYTRDAITGRLRKAFSVASAPPVSSAQYSGVKSAADGRTSVCGLYGGTIRRNGAALWRRPYLA